MKTIGKEREGKCKHNIYLASPFLPESLRVLFFFLMYSCYCEEHWEMDG